MVYIIPILRNEQLGYLSYRRAWKSASTRSSTARAALEFWLRHRGSDPGPLLCRVRRGGHLVFVRLSPQAVRVVIERRIRDAGLRGTTAHDFRRTLCGDLLDAGADLASEQGLAARRKRRFRKTTDSAHAQPIAPNVLERDFETSAPNEVWVTDVTYVWTHEGWLYLAAILDLYARRVVGWAASESNDTKLALAALAIASTRRKPPRGLVSPYASDDYRRALAHLGIVASMSRKSDCWDNAVAESFFATLKVELIDDADYATRAAATSSIRDYIESFYNRERRHSHLGYVSPVEYELRTEVASLAA